MNAPEPRPKPPNRLQEVVLTATVATLVSALISPWVRRWFDHGVLRAVAPPPPGPAPATAPQLSPVADAHQRIDRLLNNAAPPTETLDRIATPTEDTP